MKTIKKISTALALGAVVLVAAPSSVLAMEVGAWVPWFGAADGAISATKNIEKLDVVYPFVYEIGTNGKLVNKVNFSANHWQDLFEAAEEEDVLVIPTIAWFDGAQIDGILSDKSKRDAHIKEIVAMVNDNDFDGVNIDYEQKLAKTKDNFSLFLKDLNRALKKKTLTCAIEARTPPESLHRVVPANIQYANDYKAINRHCDWVELMTYDQQRADIKLNDERRGVPYNPVADKDWVEKVIKLAIKDIDEDKILLGVPTYGRAWDITVAADWYKDYTRVASLNQPRILELSKIYNSPVGRTAGGEAVISYFPEDSPWKIFNQLPTPKDTPKGYEAAAKALLVATIADIELPVRFVTWSDAKAIEDKFELIEKYNLRGTAIFKVDGEEDQALWKLL
jgi:spore germination protein YaaH